jgi:hypothetical protein
LWTIYNKFTHKKKEGKKKTNIRRLQTIFALKHELSAAGKKRGKKLKKKHNVQPTVLVLPLLLPPAGS